MNHSTTVLVAVALWLLWIVSQEPASPKFMPPALQQPSPPPPKSPGPTLPPLPTQGKQEYRLPKEVVADAITPLPQMRKEAVDGFGGFGAFSGFGGDWIDAAQPL